MARLTLLAIWLLRCAAAAGAATAAGSIESPPRAPDDDDEELARKWGFDWAFSGVSTFAHLPHHRCLTEARTPFDIGVIGAPFDTAVSYRPGARFGPRAIRAASARQTAFRGFNHRAMINPYASAFKVVDCGDIPVLPFDNTVALRQMTEAYEVLGRRPTTVYRHHPAANGSSSSSSDDDGDVNAAGEGGDEEDATAEKRTASLVSSWKHPRLVSLGGDHSVALAALRGLRRTYGSAMAVVHLDAHLDTWHPAKYPAAWGSAASAFTHGNMFWLAGQERLVANGTSVHAGLRTRLADLGDYEDDDGQGFARIHADDIDDLGGPSGVVERILRRVGTRAPVYLSLDIDVVDPGLCPGTGTPEPGGWTSRELIRILRGLAPLNLVGADVVEVAPAYDGAGEQTSLVAAQLAYELITNMVIRGYKDLEGRWKEEERERKAAGRPEADGKRDGPVKDEL